MRRALLFRPLFLAAVFAVLAVAVGRADTWTLELKRVNYDPRTRAATGDDNLFLANSSQSFFQQIFAEGVTAPRQPDAAGFAEVIKKEPEKYESKHPFRGVAQLGSQKFGFVFDEAPAAGGAPEKQPKEEAAKDQPQTPKPPRFSRLLFDVNHNGDLTDDAVIQASATPGMLFAAQYSQYVFPRVDLEVEAGGTKMPYSFTFNIYAFSSPEYQYANASLNAAVYRDGEITVDGKKIRVVVTDFNSNGRFDDLTTVNEQIRTPDGTIYPTLGDMVYVDPGRAGSAAASGYDPTTSDSQQYLSNFINIGGRFYDVQITPAGDKLTLAASAVAVGTVHNPNQRYRAIVYGSAGFMKIMGDESGNTLLPVGDWKLHSYTIDRTGIAEEPKPAAEAAPTPNLLQSLAGLFAGRAAAAGPRLTIVSADAKRDYPAVTVKAGETVELPFGPPYRPSVQAMAQPGLAYLTLSLAGTAGESCTNLIVNGGRPPGPKFTIVDMDGKEVHSGVFEYG